MQSSLASSFLKRISRSTIGKRSFAKKGGGFKSGNKGGKVGGGKRGEGGEGKGLQESLNRFVEIAEEAKAFKPSFTAEEEVEHARIAKEFQRQSSIRHNALERDVSTKIWLQQDALLAIPDHLYEEACKIDDTPPPPNRPWPLFDTPPIEGFNAKDYIKSGNEDDDDESEENNALINKN